MSFCLVLTFELLTNKNAWWMDVSEVSGLARCLCVKRRRERPDLGKREKTKMRLMRLEFQIVLCIGIWNYEATTKSKSYQLQTPRTLEFVLYVPVARKARS